MSWHPIAQEALQSKEAFALHFPRLPKKVRSLVKHMDDRFASSVNLEEKLRGTSKTDRQLLRYLVEVYQSFPPFTRFSTPKHQNKYSEYSKAPKDPTFLY